MQETFLDDNYIYSCEYCGIIVNENDKTCPLCNSNINKIITVPIDLTDWHKYIYINQDNSPILDLSDTNIKKLNEDYQNKPDDNILIALLAIKVFRGDDYSDTWNIFFKRLKLRKLSFVQIISDICVYEFYIFNMGLLHFKWVKPPVLVAYK